MSATYLNKTLLLLLVAIFLSVQWSSAHIHLSEHHSHDDTHHQHTSFAHTHQLSSHHDNLIDSAHPSVEHRVVELNQEYSSYGWNKLDDQPDLTTPPSYLNTLPIEEFVQYQPSVKSNHACWLSYTTINPRAPPIASV